MYALKGSVMTTDSSRLEEKELPAEKLDRGTLKSLAEAGGGTKSHVEAKTKQDRALMRKRQEGAPTGTTELFGRPEIPGLIPSRQPEKVLSPIQLGQPDAKFANEMEGAMRSLPPNLKDAMDGYRIYTSKTPEDFINEMRNRSDSTIDTDARIALRDRIAGTEQEGKTQNFSEWHFFEPEKRMMHFTESHNVKGTVFHEAEHALDGKLGSPSSHDEKFDELYHNAVSKIEGRIKDGSAPNWMSNYFPMEREGKIDSACGKSEVFADLGAFIRTGQLSSKLVPPQEFLALVGKLKPFMEEKIKAGEW